MSEHLLLVDDDERFRERLGAALARRGFEVHLASGGAEALSITRGQPVDRAVLDLRMPQMGGLEVLQRLLEVQPDLRVVILTGYGSIATAVDAMRLGAVGYVQKPTDADAVVAAFERADQPPLEPPDPDYDPPSLARVEWDHIQRVLADCGGNITHAARKLGVHRRTLQRKLQQYPPKN